MDKACVMCGGDLEFMGSLGRRDWYSCQHCGMEQHRYNDGREAEHRQEVLARTEAAYGRYGPTRESYRGEDY